MDACGWPGGGCVPCPRPRRRRRRWCVGPAATRPGLILLGALLEQLLEPFLARAILGGRGQLAHLEREHRQLPRAVLGELPVPVLDRAVLENGRAGRQTDDL